MLLGLLGLASATVSCHGVSLAPGSDVEATTAALTPPVIRRLDIGGRDTRILSHLPDNNYGLTTPLELDSQQDRGLFYLDRTQIESAVGTDLLLSATLELSVALGHCDSDRTAAIEVHRVTQRWVEANATWACADETTPGNGTVACRAGGDWVDGGAFDPTPLSEFRPCDPDGAGVMPSTFLLDITDDVARILASPTAQNEGWLVRMGQEAGDDIGFVRFHSRESATETLRPRVVFRTAPPNYAPAEPTEATIPATDLSAPTHVYSSMGWLLDPDRGLQWGHDPDFLDPDRAAVLGGRVYDRDTGAAIPGVNVTILGQAEAGRTRTRTVSGGYEILVNGGGPVTVRLEHPQYFTVDRTIDVSWDMWAAIPDVAMVPLGGEPVDLEFVLRADSPNGPELRRVRIAGASLPTEDAWVRFEFEPIDDSSGARFFFELSSEIQSSHSPWTRPNSWMPRTSAAATSTGVVTAGSKVTRTVRVRML